MPHIKHAGTQALLPECESCHQLLKLLILQQKSSNLYRQTLLARTTQSASTVLHIGVHTRCAQTSSRVNCICYYTALLMLPVDAATTEGKGQRGGARRAHARVSAVACCHVGSWCCRGGAPRGRLAAASGLGEGKGHAASHSGEGSCCWRGGWSWG